LALFPGHLNSHHPGSIRVSPIITAAVSQCPCDPALADAIHGLAGSHSAPLPLNEGQIAKLKSACRPEF